MIGFKKIKLQIKEYVADKNNPYLTPSDIDRGKWLAGASHCTVRKLMLSGKIPSVKVGTAVRAHYLDVIEYLKNSYLTGELSAKNKINNKPENYYQTNKEVMRKQQKEYYQIKKDKLIQQAKQYYKNNKSLILEKNKVSGRKKEYDKNYYLKNKNKIQLRKKQHQSNNLIKKNEQEK